MSEAIQALRSLYRFLRRALSDLPRSIGSNLLGVWFPLVPACFWFLYQWTQQGWQILAHNWRIAAEITFLSYLLLFLYCVIRNVYREHKIVQAKLERINAIFTPLQIEGFELAFDLRKFYKKFGPIGPLPVEEQRFRTSVLEHLSKLMDSYPPDRDPTIQNAVIYGFKNSGLPERVEKYINSVGALGRPAGSQVFTEGISNRRSLALLARDIEELALTAYIPIFFGD